MKTMLRFHHSGTSDQTVKQKNKIGHIPDTKAILKITDHNPEVIAKLKSDRYYLEDIIGLVKMKIINKNRYN